MAATTPSSSASSEVGPSSRIGLLQTELHAILTQASARVFRDRFEPNFTLMSGGRLHILPSERARLNQLLRVLACLACPGPPLVEVLHMPFCKLVIDLDSKQTPQLSPARFGQFMRAFLAVLASLVISRLVASGWDPAAARAACTCHVLQSHGPASKFQVKHLEDGSRSRKLVQFVKLSFHLVLSGLALHWADAGLLVQAAARAFPLHFSDYPDLPLESVVDLSIYKQKAGCRYVYCDKAERRPCEGCFQQDDRPPPPHCTFNINCHTHVSARRPILPLSVFSLGGMPPAPPLPAHTTGSGCASNAPCTCDGMGQGAGGPACLVRHFGFTPAISLSEAQLDEFTASASVGDCEGAPSAPAWQDQDASARFKRQGPAAAPAPQRGRALGRASKPSPRPGAASRLSWGHALPGSVALTQPQGLTPVTVTFGGRADQEQMVWLLAAHLAPYLGGKCQFQAVVWRPGDCISAYTELGTARCPFKSARTNQPGGHGRNRLFVTLGQHVVTIRCYNSVCSSSSGGYVCIMLPLCSRNKLCLQDQTQVVLQPDPPIDPDEATTVLVPAETTPEYAPKQEPAEGKLNDESKDKPSSTDEIDERKESVETYLQNRGKAWNSSNTLPPGHVHITPPLSSPRQRARHTSPPSLSALLSPPPPPPPPPPLVHASGENPKEGDPTNAHEVMDSFPTEQDLQLADQKQTQQSLQAKLTRLATKKKNIHIQGLRPLYLGNIPFLANEQRVVTTNQTRSWLLANKTQARLAPYTLAGVKWQIDHIVPKSWGGVDHPRNYVVMPASVNISFQDFLSAEKIAYIGSVATRGAKAFCNFLRPYALLGLEHLPPLAITTALGTSMFTRWDTESIPPPVRNASVTVKKLSAEGGGDEAWAVSSKKKAKESRVASLAALNASVENSHATAQKEAEASSRPTRPSVRPTKRKSSCTKQDNANGPKLLP